MIVTCHVCPVEFTGEDFRKRHEQVVHGITGYKETSREAYEEATPQLNATQKVILDLYRRHGPMTDEAMYDAYGALEPAAYRNTVLPARNALYKAGLVYDTQTRRKVKSGRTAIVWGIASPTVAEAAERGQSG